MPIDDLFNFNDLQHYGFEGFESVNKLRSDYSLVPTIRGIYMILYPEKLQPELISVGCGGYFKKKDPNVPVERLKLKWVPDSPIIYIGKAGGNNSATLRSRLKAYIRFGQGNNIGHWGGRYIWQIKNADKLIICWKKTPTDLPRKIEKDLLEKYFDKYQALPFANLRR